MIKTVLYYKTIEEKLHQKAVIAKPVRTLAVAIRNPRPKSLPCVRGGGAKRRRGRPPHLLRSTPKPRSVCRPQAAKNRDHFSPRHARGEKYLSGCQCEIFALCAKIMRAADCNPFGRKIEDFSPVICIFSRAMWMPRCDKRGLSPEKIKLRSRSGGPPPPRRAMQGPAQAGRLCFGAHFCAVPARRDPGTKKENQYFYGRKIKNHPPGRPQ